MRLSTRQATNFALGALLFAALFIFRIEWVRESEAAETLPRYIGTTAVVRGVVAADPDVRATTERITLRVKTINKQEGSGVLLAVLPKGYALAYGDTVEVRGMLAEPENFETDTGREFDYKNYLRVRGVSATMQYAQLREHTEGPPSLRRALFALKARFAQSLERALPEPQVAVLEGVLLGERGGFSPELISAFVTVGLIHIVVLSGSNISIVAEGVFRALAFLPRTLTFGVGGGAMLLFVVMTGSGAAAVRALIMGGIGLLARYLRRPEAALRALVVAAAGMLIYNPRYALEPGFVLSVLATFGLITLSPWVEQKILWVPHWPRFNLRSVVASTIAVEIFLLPALLYYSGVLSFVALPVNIVVLPFVWLVMLLGFVAGLLGLLHPVLALVPAFGADMLLRSLVWVAQTGAALPFASTVVAPFPAWVALLVYVPLIAVATRTMRQSASQPQTS